MHLCPSLLMHTLSTDNNDTSTLPQVRSADSMQTREMWGHHVPGCSSIFNARRECVVQIIGATMGTANPGWLESQRVQRHLYCVEWIPITAVTWSKASCICIGSPGRESTVVGALSRVVRVTVCALSCAICCAAGSAIADVLTRRVAGCVVLPFCFDG